MSVALTGFAFDESSPSPFAFPDEAPSAPRFVSQPTAPRAPAAPSAGALTSTVDPRATFDRIVAGQANQVALTAARRIAESPGQSFNPLYVHGRPGLGKTHLLQAVGNAIEASGKRVIYVSCEQFLNEMTACLARGRMREFRAKYRSCDALLVDDIQILAGKMATQQEFLHTFNALHASGCQIAVVSDVTPDRIDNLEERLRTRFDWGLIVEVLAPDEAHSIAILQAKADERRVELSVDAAAYLVSLGHRDVRRLEGLCNTLSVVADGSADRRFDLPRAKASVQGLGQDRVRSTTVLNVQQAVAKAANIELRELKSKSRQRAVVDARHVAMYLCRKHTRASFVDIASAFGGRDHSSIMHGARRVQELLTTDADILGLAQAAERLL